MDLHISHKFKATQLFLVLTNFYGYDFKSKTSNFSIASYHLGIFLYHLAPHLPFQNGFKNICSFPLVFFIYSSGSFTKMYSGHTDKFFQQILSFLTWWRTITNFAKKKFLSSGILVSYFVTSAISFGWVYFNCSFILIHILWISFWQLICFCFLFGKKQLLL